MSTQPLVIRRSRGGCRQLLSRARLKNPATGELTPAGRDLAERLAAVEGLDLDVLDDQWYCNELVASGYGLDMRSLHETLWPWEVIEVQVIDAFLSVLRTALGAGEVKVIYEGAGVAETDE